MKRITHIVLIVLIYLNLAAQIQNLNFNPIYTRFSPYIKCLDNKLLVNHSSGIYYIDLLCEEDSIVQNFSKNKWEIFAFQGMSTNEIAINGSKILAVTNNRYPNGHLLMKSYDNGITRYEYTPQEMIPSENISFGIDRLIQNPNCKNELLVYCNNHFYHSVDFGETWCKYDEIDRLKAITSHPLDFNFVIAGAVSQTAQVANGYFCLSRNGGKNWVTISSEFMEPIGIAFHYSNPDTIVIAGGKVMRSFDNGATWETVQTVNDMLSGNHSAKNITQISFDTRGHDRLYARLHSKFIYSDDFGTTWHNLLDNSNSFESNGGDPIVDFIQINDNLYYLTKSDKVYVIKLNNISHSK